MARPGVTLALLTALALTLRVGFLVLSHRLAAAPIEDESDYNALAQHLISGQGYTLEGAQVVNRAPAYPFFLTALYAVVGVHPSAARIVGAMLLACVVPLLYYVGRRGWTASVGLLAALVFALYPFSIFWGQYMLTENLLVFVFACGAALLVRPGEAGGCRLLCAGLVMGVALLTRPTALPVVAGLLAWLLLTLRGRVKWRAGGLLVVGVALAMLPWVARNYSVFGQFIPFTSGSGSSAGGYVFWISNNAYTAQPGEYWGRIVTPDKLPEYDRFRRLPNDPTLIDRAGYGYGFDFLGTHPAEVPMLLLGKFLRFWNVFPGDQLYTKAAGASVLLLLPFFLLGLREVWRRPQNGGMLLAFIVGTLLVGLIFWADTRTRVPAEPFIVLAAAVGAVGSSPSSVVRRRG